MSINQKVDWFSKLHLPHPVLAYCFKHLLCRALHFSQLNFKFVKKKKERKSQCQSKQLLPFTDYMLSCRYCAAYITGIASCGPHNINMHYYHYSKHEENESWKT